MKLLCVLGFIAATALAADTAKPISRADACKLRFEVFCAVMHRCSTGAEDLGGPGCEAIDPGCDRLQGPAKYSRPALEACLSGLRKVTCEARVDPSDAARLEDGVASCAALPASE